MQKIERKVGCSNKTFREATAMTRNKQRSPLKKRGDSENFSFWCERSQCMKSHTAKGGGKGDRQERRVKRMRLLKENPNRDSLHG